MGTFATRFALFVQREGGRSHSDPRVSVSRSIFALVDRRDRAYFDRGGQDGDQFGCIDGPTRAIFGRTYVAEPDVLIEQPQGGRGDYGGRHTFTNRPEPTRRCLQCTCIGGNSHNGRPCFGLALRDCCRARRGAVTKKQRSMRVLARVLKSCLRIFPMTYSAFVSHQCSYFQ
jgi:hypothetical protein